MVVDHRPLRSSDAWLRTVVRRGGAHRGGWRCAEPSFVVGFVFGFSEPIVPWLGLVITPTRPQGAMRVA